MQGRFVTRWIYYIIFCILCACAGTGPNVRHSYYPTPNDHAHAALQSGIENDRLLDCRCYRRSIPSSVSNALLPSVDNRFMYDTKRSERRFNIAADKVPARTFFMGLVEGTRYNMVVNPNIIGDITLHLKDVTIHEAMQAVRDAYGFQYRRTPIGFEVLPEDFQTQMFNVNYLNVQRSGKTLTQMSSGQISEQVTGFTTGTVAGQANQLNVTQPEERSGTSVKTKSEMDFWKGLEITVKGMLISTPGHSVAVNPQAGVVVVRALPSELHRVGRYLERIQARMDRQVILEAKVLEVQLDNQYQQGINWNLFGIGQEAFLTPAGAVGTGMARDLGGVAQSAFKTFENTDLADFASIFTLNVKGDFGTLIKLLQTQGNVQVLSSPRLSTVNNQKAIIKVGQDEFFVTGVSTNNFVTANATVPTQNVTLTPFFSGVTLDVTPQIASDGEIILHIHPTVSRVKQQEKVIQLGTVSNPSGSGTSPNTLTLPLALSTVRESDNVVHARNAQIIVIGGLMENQMNEEVAGIPFFSRIPFIGNIFRRTFQTSTKSELVILLRPMLATNCAFEKDMEKTDQRFCELDRGNHVGGFPEIFGTEGEREPFNVSRSF